MFTSHNYHNHCVGKFEDIRGNQLSTSVLFYLLMTSVDTVTKVRSQQKKIGSEIQRQLNKISFSNSLAQERLKNSTISKECVSIKDLKTKNWYVPPSTNPRWYQYGTIQCGMSSAYRYETRSVHRYETGLVHRYEIGSVHRYKLRLKPWYRYRCGY